MVEAPDPVPPSVDDTIATNLYPWAAFSLIGSVPLLSFLIIASFEAVLSLPNPPSVPSKMYAISLYLAGISIRVELISITSSLLTTSFSIKLMTLLFPAAPIPIIKPFISIIDLSFHFLLLLLSRFIKIAQLNVQLLVPLTIYKYFNVYIFKFSTAIKCLAMMI